MQVDFSHDYDLDIKVQALGYDLRYNVPFASTLIFELWLNEETLQYEVTTLLNGEPLIFGLCTKSPCPYDQF